MSNVYYEYMCWKCHKKIEMNSPIPRSAICENCGSDIRCCYNCSHYKKGVHYDCSESIDECVKDKEKANFCGWFQLSSIVSKETAGDKKSIDAKKAFNSLFGE